MYLDRTKDNTVDLIVKTCFPDYTGNKISNSIVESLNIYNTNWDGGCKREYVIFRLSDMKTFDVKQCPFMMIDERIIEIPSGFLVVVRQYSGVNQYIYIYSLGNAITPSLTKEETLTRNEMIVLVTTRSYKSSYGGESNYRFKEANRQTLITLQEWEETKQSLISKGLLNRAGAITISGKNVVGNTQLYNIVHV